MINRNPDSKSHPVDAVLFDLLLFGFFLLMALLSLGYNPRARAIPMALGVIGAFMMLVQFLVDAFPGVRRRLALIASKGLLSAQETPAGSRTQSGGQRDDAGVIRDAQEAAPALTPLEVWWPISRITLWLILFILLLAYTNYLIAVGAFIVIVTKLEKAQSWKKSISLAAGVNLGFFILFELLLKAQI